MMQRIQFYQDALKPIKIIAFFQSTISGYSTIEYDDLPHLHLSTGMYFVQIENSCSLNFSQPSDCTYQSILTCALYRRKKQNQ